MSENTLDHIARQYVESSAAQLFCFCHRDEKRGAYFYTLAPVDIDTMRAAFRLDKTSKKRGARLQLRTRYEVDNRKPWDNIAAHYGTTPRVLCTIEQLDSIMISRGVSRGVACEVALAQTIGGVWVDDTKGASIPYYVSGDVITKNGIHIQVKSDKASILASATDSGMRYKGKR